MAAVRLIVDTRPLSRHTSPSCGVGARTPLNSVRRAPNTRRRYAVDSLSRVACGPFDRLFWRVLELLWRLLAACQGWRGQGRESFGEARAMSVGPLDMTRQPIYVELAFDGCDDHYQYDISFLPAHEQAAVIGAAHAAVLAGESNEVAKMVAAIKLREICPSVNGIMESK